MTRVDLLALVRAIEGDLAQARAHRSLALAFEDRLDEPAAQTVVAASLHHYYTAIEAIAERTLRVFGQTLPHAERWHRELLEEASWELPGVRPAVFGAAATEALQELLKFRHFFRHAYAVAWRADKLRTNLALLGAGHRAIEADLEALLAMLRASATAP